MKSGHEIKVPEKLRNKNKRLSMRVLLFSIIVAFYVGFLIPYLFHASSAYGGFVIYSSQKAFESFPASMQEMMKLRGINIPQVLLVKHIYPEWVIMVISPQNFPVDSIIEVSDIVDVWHVDWHDFNLADNQAFERLAIADARQMGSFESSVEASYSSQLGGVFYNLSRIAFYAGPVMVVFSLTILFQRRIALWNLPAAFGLYSLQSWRLNVLALAHNLTVDPEWEAFGYFFVVLLPLAVYAWHYERSPGGQDAANKISALNRSIGLSPD